MKIVQWSQLPIETHYSPPPGSCCMFSRDNRSFHFVLETVVPCMFRELFCIFKLIISPKGSLCGLGYRYLSRLPRLLRV